MRAGIAVGASVGCGEQGVGFGAAVEMSVGCGCKTGAGMVVGFYLGVGANVRPVGSLGGD